MSIDPQNPDDSDIEWMLYVIESEDPEVVMKDVGSLTGIDPLAIAVASMVNEICAEMEEFIDDDEESEELLQKLDNDSEN